MGSVVAGFEVAEVALKVVGEISISSRQVNKLCSEIGREMVEDRDARTEQYVEQPLPRQPTAPERPINLAVVLMDNGRMHMRQPSRFRRAWAVLAGNEERGILSHAKPVVRERSAA